MTNSFDFILREWSWSYDNDYINCTHSKMANHMIMTLLVTSTAVPNFPESVDGFSLQ